MSKYKLNRPADAPAPVLSEESAQAQVVEFLTYYDIDPERITKPEAQEAAEKQLDHLRDYFRAGKLAVARDPQGKLYVDHTLESGAAVRYGELGAPAKLAMDAYPPDARYGRLYALMGSLSSLGVEGITKFGPKDLAVVDVLGSLFMSA